MRRMARSGLRYRALAALATLALLSLTLSPLALALHRHAGACEGNDCAVCERLLSTVRRGEGLVSPPATISALLATIAVVSAVSTRCVPLGCNSLHAQGVRLND